MKAAEIYARADRNGITLISTCASVTLTEWESLMTGTTKANGAEIRRLIKKHDPNLYEGLALDFYNPYEGQSVKKDGLLVYVHSSIEYFFKVN